MQTNHKTLKHPGLRSPGFLDLCTTAPSAASYKERLLSLSSTSNIAATKNTEKKAMTSSKVDASIPQPPPKLQVWDDVHLPSAKEKLIAKSKETPFVPIGEYISCPLQLHTSHQLSYWAICPWPARADVQPFACDVIA